MKQNVLSQVQGPTVTRMRVSRTPAARQIVLVAAAGYAIVVLFGAAYAVITAVSPHHSTSATTAIAALVAAPVALALAWPHLATLKAFGFEVSLTHATTDQLLVEGIGVFGVEINLTADVAPDEPIRLKTDNDIFTDMPAVLASLDELREAATKRVFTIDLGAGKQWLSTRLYLLAAIADDFVRVPRLVFTERLPHDGFVGMARPAAVKSALALALAPEVDTAYLRARREAATLAPDERIRHVVTEFFEVVTSIERPEGWEGGLSVPWVTSELLDTWMTNSGRVLDTRSIMTVGLSDQELVLAMASDSGDRYIALVAATHRLQQVVDRLDILGQIAAARTTSVGSRP